MVQEFKQVMVGTRKPTFQPKDSGRRYYALRAAGRRLRRCAVPGRAIPLPYHGTSCSSILNTPKKNDTTAAHSSMSPVVKIFVSLFAIYVFCLFSLKNDQTA